MAEQRTQGGTRTRPLAVAAWNVNGRSGFTDPGDRRLIELFCSKHHIDVLLLQETKLKGTDDLELQDMAIYRADRDARHRGGGVAVAIRRTIPHRPAALPRLARLEAAAIVVNTTEGEVTLVSAYLAPNRPLIDDDFDTVFSLAPRTVLAGDINCKCEEWGCNTTTETEAYL